MDSCRRCGNEWTDGRAHCPKCGRLSKDGEWHKQQSENAQEQRHQTKLARLLREQDEDRR